MKKKKEIIIKLNFIQMRNIILGKAQLSKLKQS